MSAFRFRIVLAVLSVLFSAAQASAYCRTRTCDLAKEDCEIQNGCVVSGLPLAWGSSCVGFAVQQDGSDKHGISASTLETVVSDAFATWLSADCGGHRPNITVNSLGLVSCDNVEYNKDWGNANIVMFRDDEWLPEDAANALALTILWFNPDTGLIYDADLEINGTLDEPITITGAGNAIDLRSVITHEIGHFLGLSHSGPNTVMRPVYEPGVDDLRTLSADDVAGVCSLFPADRVVSSKSCEPRHGFASDCRQPGGEDTGCTVVNARSSRAHSPFASVALLVIGALVRRRLGRASRRTQV